MRLRRAPDLPLPPPEMRALVGPTDPVLFDRAAGPLFPGTITPEQFQAVFDFGCGCGRIARRLLQEELPPERYLGIDLHRGMIGWCQQNLAPRHPGFTFAHHDVHDIGFNPEGQPGVLPFPCGDGEFTLALALSVFTHLIEADVPHYLREMRRILRPDGVAITTWFVFDKTGFPMMQAEQNALYINPIHPVNAVIFDRVWLEGALADADLAPVAITAPSVRGHQWQLALAPKQPGMTPAPWPDDDAPIGTCRAAQHIPDPHLIGVSPK